MDLTEINNLIETFKENIPMGKTKTIVMKTCMRIRSYIMNFQFTDKMLEDLASFDDKFYGPIREYWSENIVFYTVDDPDDAFSELFCDFRFAAHRIITAAERSTPLDTV